MDGEPLEYDAFISYAAEDRDQFVGPFAQGLANNGVRVWYDRFALAIGDRLGESIDSGLRSSRYGIVVISHAFFQKDWPQWELDGLVSRERDGRKVILPVWLDVDAEDVAEYSPLLADRLAVKAQAGIDAAVGQLTQFLKADVRSQPIGVDSTTSPPRALSIPTGGSTIQLPCFFPAISSVKTNLTPFRYLEALSVADHSLFLISAYDIQKSDKHEQERLQDFLDRLAEQGKVIAIDSGNYERYWKADKRWQRQQVWACLRRCAHQFAFSFDKDTQEMASRSSPELVNEIERTVLKDQRSTSGGTVIPIIHARPESLPDVAYGVADRLRPVMLALPERELGESMAERAVTLARIRMKLNTTGQYYPIHLLRYW